MRRGDAAWAAVLAGIIALLVVPPTHAWVIAATREHPYLMGFLKFAVLASLGELLAIRMVGGAWSLPSGPHWRAGVWGLLGAALALVFPVFSGGIAAAAHAGLLPSLPGAGVKLSTALWVSTVMNLTWAPTLMLYHRLTDTWLDLAGGRLSGLGSVPVADVVRSIGWSDFVGFVVLKTIPVFWIPAHTITFLLPPELRILCAAFLSLALGGILAFSRRRGAGAERPNAVAS